MPLSIAATGLVTSLGHDAATSCAAIRAGLTRAAPLPDCTVLDPDSQMLVPAIGHAVWGLTEGGSPIARWLALARQAFADLCARAALPGADDAPYWQRTAMLVVGPALDDDRFVFCPPCNPELINDGYLQPLLRALRMPIDAVRVHAGLRRPHWRDARHAPRSGCWRMPPSSGCSSSRLTRCSTAIR